MSDSVPRLAFCSTFRHGETNERAGGGDAIVIPERESRFTLDVHHFALLHFGFRAGIARARATCARDKRRDRSNLYLRTLANCCIGRECATRD